MSALIDALDQALAVAGEDIILRRRVGEKPNVAYVQVKCRARIDGYARSHTSPAGILLTEFLVIMSPTQINDAQWPGGTIPVPPPFDLDPRIPRANDTDELIISRGEKKPRVIVFCDPKFIDGELVRIDMRVAA